MLMGRRGSRRIKKIHSQKDKRHVKMEQMGQGNNEKTEEEVQQS